jgi:hypothetical protein
MSKEEDTDMRQQLEAKEEADRPALYSLFCEPTGKSSTLLVMHA